MLKGESTVLLVVDMQGNLAHAMSNKEQLFDNLTRLIKGCHVLGVPILLTEQNPPGLGPTLPQFSELLPDVKPLSKLHFSCCADEGFMQALSALKRRQVLIAGIEAHVCVYQTARDLVDLAYGVQVVSDAVASRSEHNRTIALERMREQGVYLTSTEMALFELMRVAEGATFKELLKVVK